MYEFDLDDKEFARFLLYINGYIYDELTNLYFLAMNYTCVINVNIMRHCKSIQIH